MSFQADLNEDSLSAVILKSYFLSTLSYFLKDKDTRDKKDEDDDETPHLPSLPSIPPEILYPYLSALYAGLMPHWNTALHSSASLLGMASSLPAFPSSLVAAPSTSAHHNSSPEPAPSFYDCDDRSSSPLNLSKSCESEAPSPSPSEQTISSDPETSASCYYLSRPSHKKRCELETDSLESRERKIKERREANAARERMRNKNMKQAYSWLKACLNLPPTAKQFVTLYKALETLVKCTCKSVTKLGSLKSPPLDQAAYLARLNKLLLQAKRESSTPTQHSRWKAHSFQTLENKEKERRHANAQRERKRVKELVNVMRELGRICQSYLDHKGHLGPRTYLETLHMTADIVAACTCKEEEENKAHSFRFKVEDYPDEMDETFLEEES